MHGGAAWRSLTGEGRYGVFAVTLCDPYLSALEAFAKTRYKIDVTFTLTQYYQ